MATPDSPARPADRRRAVLQEPPLTYRFTRADGAALAFYVGALALLSLTPVALAVMTVIQDPVLASYAVNFTFYLIAGLLALVAARAYVVRETRILLTRPWLTLGVIPLSVIAMLVATMVLVLITGPPQTSVNQAAAQDLMTSVSPWLVVPLFVVLAPFVEEYIFRHLLIGKLSRHWNIWICALLSLLLFAGIHVLQEADFSLPVLAPYLAMGAVLVGVYVWAGNNFMLSYAVHAAKNLLAVLLTYAVPVELLQQ
ncbi:CPBP family intramembrane metalloprotease [Arthrobacter sp. BL-252-APC-1A]|uniref:CPBP family intramembrane glutamic endopeptidase n=1 Tax=Arthrobacter sp. BL-252-APC-1A TaxID=2606622 RepID=UPI0012B31F03|nr:CPBP family intramembrane glutamic endopeptidase [Arthrobacter sp. BL-252-APC-1A]MSR97810.1 CPBP family intramembrane metalloprotease [Arthrobacter sp. BL-252-APC-1A]